MSTRVTHVITGLGTGGAEVMLDRLLGALDPRQISSQVICLASEGPIAERIRAKGIVVDVLNLEPGLSALAAIPRITARLRASRPDIVHTWMYHADLLGGVAARLTRVPVVWALHASTLDPTKTRRSTRWLIRALAKVSPSLPAHIVSCSRVGRDVHVSMGYDARKMEVIPNGFDTALLRHDPELRRQARASWSVDDDQIVVGHLARFHPQKDHRTLLEAAAICIREEPRLQFMCFGNDIIPSNASLMEQAARLKLGERCRFMGPISPPQTVLSGFDLLVSSSRFGEAFPLVIGEAMACEVPCIVTDVGDSSYMVEATGKTVAPGDAQCLARAILELSRLPRAERARLGLAARERVSQLFSLERVAARYAEVYERYARGARLGS
jgi:glycosyltransferase involved in cell wall biosynthesis